MSGTEKEYGICTWPHIFSFQVYTRYIIIYKTNFKKYISQYYGLKRNYPCKLKWASCLYCKGKLCLLCGVLGVGLLAILHSHTWMQRHQMVKIFIQNLNLCSCRTYFHLFNQIVVPHGEKQLAQYQMPLILLTSPSWSQMLCHTFWFYQRIRFSCKRDPSGVLAESIDICYHAFQEKKIPTEYILSWT